jgi:hypothetical protein
MRHRLLRNAMYALLATGFSAAISSPASAQQPVGGRTYAESTQLDDEIIEDPSVIEAACNEPAEAAPAEDCDPCNDKKKKEELKKKIGGAYKGVFYDNDFSYIGDPCYKQYFFGDNLKRIKMGCDGNLDLGGEQRVRYHNDTNNRGLGLTGRDDDFWLTRTRLFSNYKVNDWFRFYGEYIYADSAGEVFAPRAIEENRNDALNLFGDVKLLEDDSAGTWTVRGGRQELFYGSQRLISPLDWANTRQTFDGVKVLFSKGDWNIDGFWTRPVQIRPDEFDRPLTNREFYGVYAAEKKKGVDLYWLANDNHDANFRHDMAGMYLHGEKDNLLWDMEGGYQWGDNADGSSHAAGAMTFGLGRKITAGKFKTTLWGYYDWASGDDTPTGGWNHFFPLVHRFNGLIDFFGRRNINDVNVLSVTPLSEKVSFLLWYHYFFLDTTQQGPFNVNLSEFNPGGTVGDRDLGHEIDLLWTVNWTPRHETIIGFSFFDSGDYYQTSQRSTGAPLFAGDAQFFYFQQQFRF